MATPVYHELDEGEFIGDIIQAIDSGREFFRCSNCEWYKLHDGNICSWHPLTGGEPIYLTPEFFKDQFIIKSKKITISKVDAEEALKKNGYGDSDPEVDMILKDMGF